MLIKKCIVCGNELIKSKNQNKFCSRNCFNVYQNKRIETKCEYCGLLGKFKPNGRGGLRRFCSHICYSKWLLGKPNKSNTKFKKGLTPWNKDRKWTLEERKKIADGLPDRWGEKSGNWKGGITKLGASIRTMTMYKKWRTACFVRDEYTCQKCGGKTTKGKKVYLQCHHLNPFYKILIDNNIKSIDDAKKCNKLWDINNGQTLCILCHKQTDSYLKNQYTL
jgi:hypothetical protein